MRSLIVFLVVWRCAAPAEAQLRTQTVVAGLPQLVAYVADPVVPGVFYAVQQSGLVRVVENGAVLPTPFLDLRSSVVVGGEQGLLGLAFAPDAASGRLFVNFTNPDGHTVIARFRRTVNNPLVADATSRADLVWPDGNPFIAQPHSNHNGGHLAFGPDGYLYVGLGDGGSANDPQNLAQNPDSLLGKMLRIDVNVPDNHPTGYDVPLDNPFRDGSPIAAMAEIWDFGLRNPWRYSFDDPARGGTGALFIGDVGQGAREEISYAPRGAGARNYGWPIMEGALETNPTRPRAYDPLTPPVLDYERSFGFAVTGGHVYRGSALGPQYVSRYFFADYGSGRVWSVRWHPDGSGNATISDPQEHTAELGPLGSISSFGVDRAGELYIVILSGRVLKIVPPTATVPNAPGNLSAQVSGGTVALSWTASVGATQYVVEAGSQPGASNLLRYNTGTTATSLLAAGVPNGVYYVRARALNAAGASASSNEIVVTVGCAGPPPPPVSFAHMVSGRNVTLTWAATGDLISLVLEAGSAPSLANIAALVLPPSARSLSGSVPPGTYYARLRSLNACGASEPSNEILVNVP